MIPAWMASTIARKLEPRPDASTAILSPPEADLLSFNVNYSRTIQSKRGENVVRIRAISKHDFIALRHFRGRKAARALHPIEPAHRTEWSTNYQHVRCGSDLQRGNCTPETNLQTPAEA